MKRTKRLSGVWKLRISGNELFFDWQETKTIYSVQGGVTIIGERDQDHLFSTM